MTGRTTYGGQGSQFGNGGNGLTENGEGAEPHDGGVGAGGGENNTLYADTGAGGRGEIRISWDCTNKASTRVYISEHTAEELAEMGIIVDADFEANRQAEITKQKQLIANNIFDGYSDEEYVTHFKNKYTEEN
jgi:hypothetical protein